MNRYINNLKNKKFGRWTVIEQRGSDHRGALWLCRCECGNEKIVRRSVLMNGESNSCGCLALEVSATLGTKNRKIIPAGTRFGRLVVEKVHSSNKRQQLVYLCVCDCGNETLVNGWDLRKPAHTQSCGCLHNEGARKQLTKHGLYKHSWYRAFLARMRANSETDWTPEMEGLLFSIQPACVVCGSTKKLSVDHVRPASKANVLKPGNAVILCMFCNPSKGNKDLSQLPTEWQVKITQAAQEFLDAWNNR